MPHYKAIFHIPGGTALQARNGYVPDAFFEALQQLTPADLVETYEGGFVLSNEMHEKLNIPGAFSSYAIAGRNAVEANPESPDFISGLIAFLKTTNHARPLEAHYNYQVFIMEYIEETPDDD
ncbi:hypothetical protein ACLI09_10745 [Flavobacterium sp. RHBU_24]|uniref:hypothetical protein n=1 Tax=Flavobacterium sp. RHBU_24 TaxID=3391185 RepID=UPI0039850D67